MIALLTEPSSKWQFKRYFLACSNFIIWLGKMGHIILVILLHRLCLGGLGAVWLDRPGTSGSSLSKGLFYFSFWPRMLPFYLLLSDDR